MRMVKKVKVGSLYIGDGKITIQSMLNASASDIDKNVDDAKRLQEAGCEILRVAIPNEEAISLIPALKQAVDIPIVADIHFDYMLAIKACEAGVDKIRINPGNIGGDDRVAAVAKACKKRNIPIRIGVNSGSLEKSVLEKYGAFDPRAFVESALYHASLLEKHDFHDIVISLKSSNVKTMIEAYRQLAAQSDYPLHLGVTEAGTKNIGIIKNAIGIGSLLTDGIGDTIRVSLTDDPIEEIYAAKDILKALGLRGAELISCPTCGRTKIDLIPLAKAVEEALKGCDKHIKVAVMGCAVNGPGEAREADIGIAGGDGCAMLFKKGEILRKVKSEDLLKELLYEIEQL